MYQTPRARLVEYAQLPATVVPGTVRCGAEHYSFNGWFLYKGALKLAAGALARVQCSNENFGEIHLPPTKLLVTENHCDSLAGRYWVP